MPLTMPMPGMLWPPPSPSTYPVLQLEDSGSAVCLLPGAELALVLQHAHMLADAGPDAPHPVAQQAQDLDELALMVGQTH